MLTIPQAMDTPQELVVDSPSSTKRSRRQVAFYPNMNSSNKPQKPFSRSAAKRESVMALGSIEYLQHYFTKSGIAASSDPLNKPNSGMVPAIGGPSGVGQKPFLPGLQEIDLPPSPTLPEIIQPAFSPYVKTYEVDSDNLRPGVIEDLSSVEQAWGLSSREHKDLLSVDEPKSKAINSDPGHVDVLGILKTTTRAVRSVRNYIVSLPDDSATPLQRQFRTPALSSTPLPKRHVSQPNSSSDPLSRIRSAALEVLIVLRALEEASRLPLSDDAYDAQSDHGDQPTDHGSVSGSASGSGSGGHSRGASPDFLDADADMSISFVQVGGGLRSVPVWEDEAESFDMNHGADEERKERWDERLVLGGGWLYRQDVTCEELSKERDVVERYLNVVDEVLFGGTQDGKRGWEVERGKAERDKRGKGRRASEGVSTGSPEGRRSNRRVVSTGMLDAMRGLVLTEEPEEEENVSGTESVEDDDLPDWAKRSMFTDDPLGRAHALLKALLPSALQPLLSPTSERALLLQALSSGQLLCAAYNTGVRRSRKPWGYVSKDAIHDIATLESQSVDDEQHEKVKRGWTFRRTDNLRLWAAALKLRYLIPVITPNPSKSGLSTPNDGSTPLASPSPSMQRFPTTEPPILFDAPIVARQENGWEEMLEITVLRWVDAVVDERRGDR